MSANDTVKIRQYSEDNTERAIIQYWNINSIQKEKTSVENLVRPSYSFLISEWKLDSSYFSVS